MKTAPIFQRFNIVESVLLPDSKATLTLDSIKNAAAIIQKAPKARRNFIRPDAPNFNERQNRKK